jgi:DNA-binding XRE family transcriptional regulator
LSLKCINRPVVNFLEEQRVRAGLLQDDLAKKAGVGKSTIVKIETGVVQPRRDTCQRLAKALDIKPGVLASKLARATEERSNQAQSQHSCQEVQSSRPSRVDGMVTPAGTSGGLVDG